MTNKLNCWPYSSPIRSRWFWHNSHSLKFKVYRDNDFIKLLESCDSIPETGFRNLHVRKKNFGGKNEAMIWRFSVTYFAQVFTWETGNLKLLDKLMQQKTDTKTKLSWFFWKLEWKGFHFSGKFGEMFCRKDFITYVPFFRLEKSLHL